MKSPDDASEFRTGRGPGIWTWGLTVPNRVGGVSSRVPPTPPGAF